MSLETAIRENTAALAALTAALTATAGAPPAASVPGTAGVSTAAPVQEKPASKKRGQTEKVDTPPEPAPELDYERDVKPSVLRAAAKDKPAVKEVLAKFGVERGVNVPAAELPMFLACIEEVLANG